MRGRRLRLFAQLRDCARSRSADSVSGREVRRAAMSGGLQYRLYRRRRRRIVRLRARSGAWSACLDCLSRLEVAPNLLWSDLNAHTRRAHVDIARYARARVQPTALDARLLI